MDFVAFNAQLWRCDALTGAVAVQPRLKTYQLTIAVRFSWRPHIALYCTERKSIMKLLSISNGSQTFPSSSSFSRSKPCIKPSIHSCRPTAESCYQQQRQRVHTSELDSVTTTKGDYRHH